MNRHADRLLRAVFPYGVLASLRISQLFIAGNLDFWERMDRKVFFRRAFWLLQKNQIPGDYAEFGCHGGMTFVLAYYNSQRFSYPHLPRKQWAFDSFRGFPPQQGPKDSHPEWIAGSLRMSEGEFIRVCSKSGVPRSAYETVPGFYQDTIGRNATATPANLPRDIALAYIDCDLYSSTAAVLEFLSTRLKHGMIIGLDDYYCYSTDAAAGERVALLEFCRSIQDQYRLVPYVQFGYAGMSFIVEDRRLTEHDPTLLLSH